MMVTTDMNVFILEDMVARVSGAEERLAGLHYDDPKEAERVFGKHKGVAWCQATLVGLTPKGEVTEQLAAEALAKFKARAVGLSVEAPGDGVQEFGFKQGVRLVLSYFTDYDR